MIPFGILWLGKQPNVLFGSQLESACVHAPGCVLRRGGCFVGDEGLSELVLDSESEPNTLRGDEGSNCC